MSYDNCHEVFLSAWALGLRFTEAGFPAFVVGLATGLFVMYIYCRAIRVMP